METASSYFTRRARQERANAADAGSAAARKAHLELALRLVKVAIEPSLRGRPEGAVQHDQTAEAVADMGAALAGAFLLLPAGKFESLLEAVSTTKY